MLVGPGPSSRGDALRRWRLRPVARLGGDGRCDRCDRCGRDERDDRDDRDDRDRGQQGRQIGERRSSGRSLAKAAPVDTWWPWIDLTLTQTSSTPTPAPKILSRTCSPRGLPGAAERVRATTMSKPLRHGCRGTKIRAEARAGYKVSETQAISTLAASGRSCRYHVWEHRFIKPGARNLRADDARHRGSLIGVTQDATTGSRTGPSPAIHERTCRAR